MQTGKISLYFPGIINFPLEKYIFLLLSKQITAKKINTVKIRDVNLGNYFLWLQRIHLHLHRTSRLQYLFFRLKKSTKSPNAVTL